MRVIAILFLIGISFISCADKSKVVFIENKKQADSLTISPETKKEIKNIVSNKIKHPITKLKELEQVIKKEKIKTKKEVERKISKIITPYKKERIKKEIALLKEPITPIKTPDKVLRILVLPYVDNEGSFHSGEYIFVKVEEGKWILGNHIKSGKEITKEFNPLIEEK